MQRKAFMIFLRNYNRLTACWKFSQHCLFCVPLRSILWKYWCTTDGSIHLGITDTAHMYNLKSQAVILWSSKQLDLLTE